MMPHIIVMENGPTLVMRHGSMRIGLDRGHPALAGPAFRCITCNRILLVTREEERVQKSIEVPTEHKRR